MSSCKISAAKTAFLS